MLGIVFLTDYLGRKFRQVSLQTICILKNYSLVNVKKNMHWSIKISYFSDLNNELISLAEEVVIRSDIVLQPLLPFWDAALTSFRQHRSVLSYSYTCNTHPNCNIDF